MIKYKPFKSIKNVYIDNNYLIFKLNNKQIKLEIKKGKYIPKSGLLFKNVLNDEINNLKILDLGCGYLGILSILSYCWGANKIDSIDIDDDAINWFQYIIESNGFDNINCFKSDYFENITEKYDVILANPPQMPMNSPKSSIHDSGGADGRKYILKILKDSFSHLNKKGIIYILLFDFLGINKKTNKDDTIIDIAKRLGYKNIKIQFKDKKYIKKESVTYKNLKYIKQVYPNYKLKRDIKGRYINIYILKLEK